jgi:hypothetical protein
LIVKIVKYSNIYCELLIIKGKSIMNDLKRYAAQRKKKIKSLPEIMISIIRI